MNRSKAVKTLIRIIENVFNNLLLTVFMLIVFFVLYVLLDNYKIISNADSSQYKPYKPVKDDSLSFSELTEMNSDVIGWITIDNTNIDYPIVQGETNETYVNMSVYKEFSLTGAIFLDSRNSSDFSDTVSIIYGHNMVGNSMFGGIDLFEDTKYFNEHLTGTLFCNGEYYELKIFEYFKANGYDASIYNVAVNEETYMSWINNIFSNSIHCTGNIPESGRILLMSTCAAGETDGRRLLAASITPGGNPPDSDNKNYNSNTFLLHINSNIGKFNWKHLISASIILLLLTCLFIRNKSLFSISHKSKITNENLPTSKY